MTMTTLASDIARLRELESELDEINHRIDQARPHSPRHTHPLDMAWHYSAQAASGCAQAARYLEMGGGE